MSQSFPLSHGEKGEYAMKNIEKYKSLLETGEVDALLLTSEYNRLYAAQYSIAEGVAVVTKDGAYYFTDSR